MAGEKEICAYSDWPSPVTAGWLGGRLRLEDVQWTPDGKGLVWVEGRSGQGMLVYRRIGGETRDLLGEQSARGGLLYGGGEFGLNRNWIYFIDRGKRLFRLGLDRGEPAALTGDETWLASPTLSPDGGWAAVVSSDGREDWLTLVDSTGTRSPIRFIQGADFFMQPAWSPDGSFLAWVEWDHPNMPWDASRLMLARLGGEPPAIIESTRVAGDGRGNFTQPRFSPDGRWLSYIASRGEWDALVLRDLTGGAERILLEGERVLLAMPAWVQGVRSTAWSFDSRRVFAIQHYAGRAELISVEITSGKTDRIETRPYTWLRQISASPRSDELAVIASSPQIPDRIVHWDGHKWQVLARSDVDPLPEEYFSVPEELSWQSADGSELHAFYFPPTHPQFDGKGAPPLIVSIHGGPTHLERLEFPREAPYFTSRGYAWLEVCYRGSLGYGRSYFEALCGRWGELDLEDAVSAAQEAVRRGLADPSRLVLYGGSAGGLTVLNALAKYPGRFMAGICLYPVTDLLDPGLTADKFESRYFESLIGPLPAAEPLYRLRSPLYHADQIKDPLALFHGSDDTAVPVGQSEEIAANLRSRGVPVLLQIYEGEGHGFRQAENLEDCFLQIEGFLKEQFERGD